MVETGRQQARGEEMGKMACELMLDRISHIHRETNSLLSGKPDFFSGYWGGLGPCGTACLMVTVAPGRLQERAENATKNFSNLTASVDDKTPEVFAFPESASGMHLGVSMPFSRFRSPITCSCASLLTSRPSSINYVFFCSPSTQHVACCVSRAPRKLN
jgi:hypothetical protein